MGRLTVNRRIPVVFSLVVLCAALVLPGLIPVQTVQAATPGGHKVEVTEAVHHDLSPPLRTLAAAAKAPSGPQAEVPLLTPPDNSSRATTKDPVIHVPTNGPKVGAPIGQNFAGVGAGDYGYTDHLTPPDTNGAVGATQYVQMVNASYAVFNKSTGALLLGPANNNTLWTGFGGGCEANNNGDPIAQYDKAAGRWVLSQFSITNPTTYGYLQCVAVSQTSDATGMYYRYAFSYGTTEFNDYGKIGVWPDGYYITYNIFNSKPDAPDATLQSFGGAKACAFDRTRMLSGLVATQQCYDFGTSWGNLLPSDLDGSNPPPAGSPNYLMTWDNNLSSLDEFKYHVDWATPANTAMTGPFNIPVAAFTPSCLGIGSRGTCVPQPGTTSMLDTLTGRPMYRLAYRNFGDHESLVFNYSVNANSVVGVRWYEIRDPNGTPSVYQQQTYGGDSVYRWMGSVAMDHNGDMALGYSMSSSTLFPQIVYTGRLVTDPLGTMQSEAVIQSGGGSETGSFTRWGDYSAMTVDPINDCTFWYTQQYWGASGAFNWRTKIASFTFPSCGTTGPPPTPTGLAATGSGFNYVTWTWTNGDPTAYVAVTDGTNTFGLAAGTTSYTKYGIPYGGYAGISIAAFHDINNPSAFTPYVFGLTTPITPYNPHTTGATLTTVAFGWSPYDSVSQIAVSDGTTVTLLGTAATAYTKTGVASGYYACVSVQAYNALHASAWSPYACGYTLPTTPNMPTASGHTSSSVTFVWTNHDPYSYIALTNGGSPQALGQNVTTYTQTGMSAGQYACIKIAAYNYAGASAYTANWACGQAA